MNWGFIGSRERKTCRWRRLEVLPRGHFVSRYFSISTIFSATYLNLGECVFCLFASTLLSSLWHVYFCLDISAVRTPLPVKQWSWKRSTCIVVAKSMPGMRVRRSFWWHRSMASMLFGSTVVNLRRLLGQRQRQQGLDAFEWLSIKPCQAWCRMRRICIGYVSDMFTCWLLTVNQIAVSIAWDLAASTCQIDSSWWCVMSTLW